MWLDAFRAIALEQNTFPNALLAGRVRFSYEDKLLGNPAIERASGLLSVRNALSGNRGRRSRLFFLVPNVTDRIADYLTAVLIVADLVYRQRPQYVASETSAGPSKLLQGDVLLVTQKVTDCVQLLRGQTVGKTRIDEIWHICPLSKYTPPMDSSPRVFVANPGWVKHELSAPKFGAVIVDASHPRTLSHLEEILAGPAGSSPVQLIVTPPLQEWQLDCLGDSDLQLKWLWDPEALHALESVVSTQEQPTAKMPKRTIWVCNDDQVDTALESIHQILVGTTRASGGESLQSLAEAWSIYHRLRQLIAPLRDVEEAGSRAYSVFTLKHRLEFLDSGGPDESPAVGIQWPRLIELLHTAYELLLRRDFPVKFWVLADVLEQYLSRDDIPKVRIVVPTEHEATLLTAILSDLFDDWADMLYGGKVELSTIRKEPLLCSQQQYAHTILAGFRTGSMRYLDIYPERPIDVITYPHEAALDQAIQSRLYRFAETLQDEEPRIRILKQLGLTCSKGEEATPTSSRPEVCCQEVSGCSVEIIKLVSQEDVALLDLDDLARTGAWTDEIPLPETGEDEPSDVASLFRNEKVYVEVVFAEGYRTLFPSAHFVDVYYSSSDLLTRVAAGQLSEGMRVVTLVDDVYGDLFQRLLEGVNERRDPYDMAAIELWKTAKFEALRRCNGNRRLLHQELSKHGLSVQYEALAGWYRTGEDEIIAPRSRNDFQLLWQASGGDEKLLGRIYQCIEAKRVLHRRIGRQLRSLLRQIATGADFEVLLESADVLGTEVKHVASAVEFRTVHEVHPANYSRLF